jgi:uncharacterized sulfatase
VTLSRALAKGRGSMKKQPNILPIVSEDNGQHLSCYGDENVKTPHLDALATSGVQFRNAYCTQAVFD